MARPLRIHVPGRAYHLVARGNNKQCIFRDAADYWRFLDLLARGLARFDIRCVAYCLLWNHYHLLVVPGRHSVSRLMQYVNSRYCQQFNTRHNRVGHVLQGRFGSQIIDDAAYMISALRYIAMNPVAASRVRRPEQWKWSSYRATAGLERPPDWLSLPSVWQAFNCRDAATGRRRYLAHVALGLEKDELTKALLFGGEVLAKRVAPLLVPHQREIDFTYGHRFAARPPLQRIFRDADTHVLRARAAAEAYHHHGYTLREIGELLGRDPSTVCRWIKTVEVPPRKRQPAGRLQIRNRISR